MTTAGFFRRTALAPLLALALSLCLPPTVEADPPPWAPAHGYRSKHKHKHKHKYKQKHQHGHGLGWYGYEHDTRAIGIPWGECNREVVGGLLGGAIGGAVGSQIGKGDGKLAATAAGTVIGYLIGSAIGRSMDDVDQSCAGQVLERASDRQTVAWVNPDDGARYEMTPVRTFRDAGQYCREYEMDALIEGRARTVVGTACRDANGAWRRTR